MKTNHLSVEQLVQMAPSIAAASPSPGASSKYSHVRTLDIIPQLEEQGWLPVRAREAFVKPTSARRGYQKHVVSFRHISDESRSKKHFKHEAREHVIEEDAGPTFFELNLTNSSDRSCAYDTHLGLWRQICANGLIVSIGNNSLATMKIRHIHVTPNEILAATNRAVAMISPIMSRVDEMRQCKLTERKRLDFAEAALMVKYENMGRSPIGPGKCLEVRRKEDIGMDVWRTFNVVQENILMGGQLEVERLDCCGKGYSPSLPIKSLDRQLWVNEELWKLADGMLN